MLLNSIKKNKIVLLGDIDSTDISFFQENNIVLCHGVFDVLHIGHIKHFHEAKKNGDILIVSITPDKFVNKGPGRPIFNQELRAQAIIALAVVDFVIINDFPTATEIIKLIKPNFYVKGCEYRDFEKDITGKITEEHQAVIANGGEVLYTEDITFSSSSIINKCFPQFSNAVMNYLDRLKSKYTLDDILSYIDNTSSLKVAVIGESIIDKYIYCDALGKVGKEPVLATKKINEDTFLGGILAIANHVANFASEVDCYTILGDEQSNKQFIEKNLHKKIKFNFIQKKKSPTIQKIRYLDNYLRQKLFEVYEINDNPLDSEEVNAVLNYVNEIFSSYDLVVVADYGHGFFNKQIIEALRGKCKFLAVNAQANAGNNGFNCISKYPNADFITIAQRELDLTFRIRNCNIRKYIELLTSEYQSKNVLVTNGRLGCTIYTTVDGFYDSPALATNVTDRIGAGDSVLSITSLLMAQDAPGDIIAFIANVVGAEAVSFTCNSRFIEKVPLKKHISHLLK